MANHLKVAKVSSIHELHAQGWSQRRIAKELGVSRGAVARPLRAAANGAKAPTGSSLIVTEIMSRRWTRSLSRKELSFIRTNVSRGTVRNSPARVTGCTSGLASKSSGRTISPETTM